MNNKYRLVLIEWVDSYGCSPSWAEISEIEPKSLHCFSVGWLVHDDEKHKVIVPHFADGEQAGITLQGCGDMSIPTVAVVSIKDLMPILAVGGSSLIADG
jgi:hypothetical protein